MIRDIHQYGENPRGSRNVGFRVGNCDVLIQPDGAEDNEQAMNLAGVFAALPEFIERAEGEARELRDRIARLEQKVPPVRPGLLMGRGYVRFTDSGQIWLLNNREKGWGHFGFRIDDWDDLFRRWNVRVVEHGTDEHGPWWAVENCAATETPATGGTK